MLQVRYYMKYEMLSCWFNVSEAEEKMRRLKMQAIMLYRLWYTFEDLDSISSTLINCLYEGLNV